MKEISTQLNNITKAIHNLAEKTKHHMLTTFSIREMRRSVELLSLFLNHPTTPSWFASQHKLFHDALQEVKSELSSDAFNTAWERGKILGLETVMVQLLAEFEHIL